MFLIRAIGWASGGCRRVILQPRGGKFCNHEEVAKSGVLGDFESGWNSESTDVKLSRFFNTHVSHYFKTVSIFADGKANKEIKEKL